MPLKESYAIWNNKGGVGKSTITFHLASRYAELHPEQKVLVIDLCPQSNSSMMLLGGGAKGEANVLNLCTQTVPQTVVGYLSTVISGGQGAALPNPYNFLVNTSQFNPELSNNLYLLCGDGNLEPMAPAISGAAALPSLTPSSQPWVWVHNIFRAFVDSLVSGDKSEWMIFVDTNPSFSIYTELAISAVNKIITPVNADDSSRVATNAMFILLHGQVPPHPIYGSWTYAARAQTHSMHVPLIHMVIGNRLTQLNGPANAFKALSDATADTLFLAYQNHPSYFTTRKNNAVSLQDFRDDYSAALRDFNTAGVVAAHLGKPLSRLAQGYYPVHGIDVKVNADKVQECRKAIDHVLSYL